MNVTCDAPSSHPSSPSLKLPCIANDKGKRVPFTISYKLFQEYESVKELCYLYKYDLIIQGVIIPYYLWVPMFFNFNYDVDELNNYEE